MPRVQGPKPKVFWSRQQVGIDNNGRYTTNVHEYRGRDYTAQDVVDMKAIDYEREVARQSRQKGLRTVALWCTSGTRSPSV